MEEFKEEEDNDNILNSIILRDPNSEQNTIKKKQEAGKNMMLKAGETNDILKNYILNDEELTPEEKNAIIGDYHTDNDTQKITEEITQDITQIDDNNNKLVKMADEGIKTITPSLKNAEQDGNLSAVIELLNSIAGLLLAAPVDYKNNVISSFADDIADMRDNGRRIFKDKEQVLTFLNGILSGSLHRQPQRIKESVKNDTLTRNKILNPKLKNRKPRPFTKKNNYVYKGNSLKTVI